MAGVYVPVVAFYPTNVVTVSSLDGTTYNQIINSMGSFVYGINKIYLKSNNNSQLIEPINFSQYDVNGTLEKYSQIVTVDPYQFQSSSIFELAKDNVYLNGRTSLTTSVLPNEDIFLVLYTTEIANRDYMEKTDFFKIEFFNDFADEI